MDLNYAEISTVSSNKTRSVFYCPYAPDYMWDLNDTTFPLIFAAFGAIASPITILLNALVIIAVKQRKELQRLPNVRTSSMAVADLLAGGICLPLTVTVGLLVAHQGHADEHIFNICMLDSVTVYFTLTLYMSSLSHLIMIAWERYVAIRKWMEYKVIVTRTRLRKLAIIAWFTAVLVTLPGLFTISLMEGGNQNSAILIVTWHVVNTVFQVCALAIILYFYVMVYLGVRKRKLSQICQVNVLMQVKLENRIAMTFALVVAALILTFVPEVVIGMLGGVFPVLRKSSAIWVAGIFLHLQSTLNPLIYCYRDRRFRNAMIELLRIKKPLEKQMGAVSALQFVNRKVLSRSVEDVVELRNSEKNLSV